MGLEWDQVIRMKDEGAMLHHAGGVVAHGGFGLDVQVAEHLIAAPPADQADHISVNFGGQESHGASGAE